MAHTRSRFEKALAWDLLRARIPYFLPLTELQRVSGGRRQRSVVPLFPGYVFFCGDPEVRFRVLRTNRVASTLPVPDQSELINELGAIAVALEVASLEVYPRPPIGRRVRIVSGPFEGLEGTVVRSLGRDRVVLQMSVIGQGAILEVQEECLRECA